MKKQVTVTKENREFLEKAFKVSSVMIWKALTFESDTDLARRIRKLAVERGGIEMCFCPVLETMHDSDGYMRQYLPNGAMLEFNKNDGNGSVFFKGWKSHSTLTLLATQNYPFLLKYDCPLWLK